jgi:hypothetical protein
MTGTSSMVISQSCLPQTHSCCGAAPIPSSCAGQWRAILGCEAIVSQVVGRSSVYCIGGPNLGPVIGITHPTAAAALAMPPAIGQALCMCKAPLSYGERVGNADWSPSSPFAAQDGQPRARRVSLPLPTSSLRLPTCRDTLAYVGNSAPP